MTPKDRRTLNYELGEIRSPDGTSMGYKTMSVLGDYVQRISAAVRSTSSYKRLLANMPSERVLTYFQLCIKDEIAPYVRLGCAIQWHKDNNRPVSKDHGVVTVPRTGILNELVKCWDFKGAGIRSVSPLVFVFMDRGYLKRSARAMAKRVVYGIRDGLKFAESRDRINFTPPPKGVVAVHYSEGIDVTLRNDLNWYFGNSIRPGNVLIYFDSESLSKYRPMKREIVERIEKMGFRWVSLRKGAIEGVMGDKYWSCPRISRNDLIKKDAAATLLEEHVREIGNDLLGHVRYWRTFYDDFHVRLHYIPDCGYPVNIAQSIAYDVGTREPGLTVGRQRSEMSIPTRDEIGFDVKHVFFIWAERVLPYFKPNYDRVKEFVITGYPFNAFSPSVIWPDVLRSKGAKFVVTLYDNTFSQISYLSRRHITAYYREFLEWLIGDNDIGLIIKSKRPLVIDSLPEIHELLDRAMETGRCVIIDELGRHPLEASSGSDMSVGFGISSSIVEVTTAGLRGIHCDMTCHTKKEFYAWGCGEIVFNKPEDLIKALKDYKEDPRKHPRLGDWSGHIDKLDPFHDGKGGDRMGAYMGWLFDALIEGKNRDEAIRHASSLYKEKWGEDKIAHIDAHE